MIASLSLILLCQWIGEMIGRGVGLSSPAIAIIAVAHYMLARNLSVS